MENVQQNNDISEEVLSIIEKIKPACRKKRTCDVIVALGLTLIAAIMVEEECSVAEAIEHMRNVLDAATATHSPRH
jgi:hypothetical protein